MMAEAEVVADEDERVPETPTLFNTILFEEGQPEPLDELTLCHLTFVSGEGGEEGFSSVIPITCMNGKLLVAVPQGAWHRSIARRYLPATALSKAVCVEVAADIPGEAPSRSDVLRVWVGYLQKELAVNGVVGPSDEPGCLNFGEDIGRELLPSPQALFEVANDQFGFFSAPEISLPGSVRGGGNLEARMGQLENSLEAIRKSLEAMNPQKAPVPPLKAAPKPAGRSSVKARGSVPEEGGVLDPGVVAAGRQAGITEAQLDKLEALVSKPNGMTDRPRARAGRRGALSESEEDDIAEEEAGDVEVAEAGEGAPVEKAVIQLTKLVSQLSKQRVQSKGIEGIFDKLDGGGGEAASSTGGGGRSKAVAYKKLKQALQDKPDWLYRSVEDLLEEDFAAVRQAPGLAGVPFTCRGWLEHRSKLQYYPNTIRFGWVLSGILDSLRAGNHGQARARTALALAALDQSSIDAGSWVLAQELLFEPPAPFSSFQRYRGVDHSEQVASRLIDDRILEVLLWRIKDRDAYLESRRRLAGAGREREAPKAGPGPPRDPNPKGAPKVKPKAKQRGGQSREGLAEEPQQEQ